MFNLFVAVDKDGGFAKNNTIPWKFSSDMKFFSKMTKVDNSYLIMGRKTYESIGFSLPGRTTIVVTSDTTMNVKTIRSLKEILSIKGVINICGGEQIYKEFIDMNIPHNAYVTFIDNKYDCDRFMPNIYLNKVRKNGTILNEVIEKDVKLTFYQLIV